MDEIEEKLRSEEVGAAEEEEEEEEGEEGEEGEEEEDEEEETMYQRLAKRHRRA
jgi:hypothetical protein